MAIKITVPRLGWSMDEGTLTEWLKREGEYVRKGEMVFVLEGDKAAQEIESFDEGILRLLPDGPRPGDTVQVGQLLAYLVVEGELPPFEGGAPAVEFAPSGEPPPVRESVTEADAECAGGPEVESVRPRATPRARRRATEVGVDWITLAGKGTGKGGRIRERDVLAALHRQPTQAPETNFVPGSLQPHSPIRRTIAERMVASLQTTAPVTLTTTSDATQLVALRQRCKALGASPENVVPTVTDILVKLTAGCLQSHPRLNARWEDEGVVTIPEIHIGIAVDTDAGLLVPVVRDVERLSLQSLAARTQELVAKARARRLAAAEMQGGTFTVTNLGSYGIDGFTPILQPGQCAILGVGRIIKQPVFIGERFEPRDVMTLSLTFDHRIIDGGPAARFLQAVVQAIEHCAGLPA